MSGITGDTTIVDLAVGGDHNFIITADGKAYSFGQDWYGKGGRGTMEVPVNQPEPMDLDVDTGPNSLVSVDSFVTIDSRAEHGCGITGAGALYCWGHNDYGQLGDGTTIDRSTPVKVSTENIVGDRAFKAVATGRSSTCGLTVSGAAYCWGANLNFGLGDGTNTDRLVPVAVDTSTMSGAKTFSKIAVGNEYACGIATDGITYCWGQNNSGTLGSGYFPVIQQTPYPVTTTNITDGESFIDISANEAHSCGLTASGNAYCWGYDGGQGRLGDNGGASSGEPILVDTTNLASGDKFFKSLTAGIDHTCGITAGGKAYCWGANSTGQVGDNSTTNRLRPVAVTTTNIASGGENFVQSISTGYYHGCVVTVDGRSLCWGNGSLGRIGDNAETNRLLPVSVDMTNVSGTKAFTQISGGSDSTCALNPEGVPYCWGNNANGRLGDGTTTKRLRPVSVDTSGI